jgi:hypothetical protein
MPTVINLLMTLAVVLFLIGVIPRWWAPNQTYYYGGPFMCAGLFCWALSELLTRGYH